MKYLFPALGILSIVAILFSRIIWLALLDHEDYAHHNSDLNGEFAGRLDDHRMKMDTQG